MSHERPAPGCWELVLSGALPLPPAAQVALEDYARALTGADSAAVVAAEDGALVGAVHVCGAPSPPGAAAREDLDAFARELAAREGGGLGWS